MEQQKAIFTQLIQGQVQLQQELAGLKQTTAEVLTMMIIIMTPVYPGVQPAHHCYSSSGVC